MAVGPAPCSAPVALVTEQASQGWISLDGILIRRRGGFRSVLQNEAAECGLACLAMIASSFGFAVTLAELRRRFSVSAKGATLKTLMDMADVLGLTTRPVRLELDEIDNLKLPAILHWNLKHYVVLERIGRGTLTIHDPARGRRRVDRAEASRSFTGVALEFAAGDNFERREKVERVNLRDLFGSVRGLTPSLVQILSLAAIMQFFAMISPILNQLVIDEAITKGDLNLATVLAVGLAILLVTTTAVRFLQGLVGLYLGTQLSFQMQTNLLRHTLRLPVAWFEKRHIGDILSRFSSLGPVQDFVSSAVVAIILSSIIVALSLVMMVLYSPMLSSIEVGAAAFFVLVGLAAFPVERRLTEQGLHLGAKVNTVFLETLRGARSFKLFGRERERVSLWQNEQAALINNQIRLSRFNLIGGSGTGLLAGGQQIIVWLLGARMVIRGELSLGMLFAFQAYTSQFSGAVATIAGQILGFRTMRIHLERLADIVHADLERGLDLPIDSQQALRGGLELRKLSFRYADQEPWVLRDCNLRIEPGEFVCFQGPSGEGKSTLLKVMLGFHDPQEGEVLVDGVPLRSFGIRTYRDRIGVVLQDDQLFAGTIAENIAFFDHELNMEAVEAAAKAAQMHIEINALPMGYHTLTGDLGSTLSGGQRQRLLLARALYRQPQILFLDEGTANLDPKTEASVMDAIRSMAITRVVVAHREGASIGASRFITVAHSQVVEA